MKKILVGVVLIIAIVGCVKLLELQDNYNKNNAIKTCGKNNVVIKYTNQGDRYYTCKVEK